MIDETSPRSSNVIAFPRARLAQRRSLLCRHCGAALGDGESEDECSGAGQVAQAMRRRLRAE